MPEGGASRTRSAGQSCETTGGRVSLPILLLPPKVGNGEPAPCFSMHCEDKLGKRRRGGTASLRGGRRILPRNGMKPYAVDGAAPQAGGERIGT